MLDGLADPGRERAVIRIRCPPNLLQQVRREPDRYRSAQPGAKLLGMFTNPQAHAVYADWERTRPPFSRGSAWPRPEGPTILISLS